MSHLLHTIHASVPAVYPSPQGSRMVLWQCMAYMLPMPAVYPDSQGSRLVCRNLWSPCYLCRRFTPALKGAAWFVTIYDLHATYAGGLPQPSREPHGLAQALQSMQNHAIHALFKTIVVARCYFQKPKH